jgi:hypothetical protein
MQHGINGKTDGAESLQRMIELHGLKRAVRNTTTTQNTLSAVPNQKNSSKLINNAILINMT